MGPCRATRGANGTVHWVSTADAVVNLWHKIMKQSLMHDQATLPWHAIEPAGACERLACTPEGLCEDEVQQRQESFGPNRLKPPQRTGPIKRFLLHFHNVVIYVLLVAAVVAGALGHWIDSAVIFAVVLINATIGFIQEGKAEKALDAVRKMLSPMALVMRSGQRQNVPAEQLVPGDIVVLQSGDKVPADLRLLRLKDLRVDESALTGESVPVDKAVEPVEPIAAVGDRYSMAFAGTLVTYGQATGVVVDIGEQTEIGRISEMLAQVEELTTPLLQKISHLGRVISLAVVGLAVLLFAFGLLVRDYEPAEIFMAASGVGVGDGRAGGRTGCAAGRRPVLTKLTVAHHRRPRPRAGAASRCMAVYRPQTGPGRIPPASAGRLVHATSRPSRMPVWTSPCWTSYSWLVLRSA